MLTFGLSMTAGPLLAGVLVATIGFGWTYTIDVISFTFALWGGLFKLPPLPPSKDAVRPGLRSVVEGFRFLGTRPNVRMTFIIDLIAMICAQPPRALMPAIGAVMIGGGRDHCWSAARVNGRRRIPGRPVFRALGAGPQAGQCRGVVRDWLGARPLRASDWWCCWQGMPAATVSRLG